MSLYKDASLVMIPSAYKDGKLYSIRPTDGSGDFTFSRGSNLAATRVDVNGLIEKGRENLLLQSNQFDTTWTTNNASVTGGQSDKDGGTDAWELKNNSGATNTSRVQQLLTASSGVYSFSVYAKAGNVNYLRILSNASSNIPVAWFDLTDGTSYNASNTIDTDSEDVGGGWYRCTITFNNSSTGCYLYPTSVAGSTLSGNGEYIYIQDAQLEAGLVATDYIETGASTAQAGILEDMPRLDYSGSCPALLLEPQRSNFFIQSEYFGGSEWTKLSASVVDNDAVSPDGLQNACKVTTTSGGGASNINEVVYKSANTTYAFSIFVKAGNVNRVVIGQQMTGVYSNNIYDLSTNTWVVTGTGSPTLDAEDYGNGWYRLSCTMNSGASAANYQCWVGPINSNGTSFVNTTAGNYIYTYGATFEQGSYPTSYIPTYGSSVTRSQEYGRTPHSSYEINEEQGVIFAEFEYLGGTDFQVVSMHNGGSLVDWLMVDSAGRLRGSVFYNSTYKVTMDSSPTTLSANTNYKAAFRYESGNNALYLNGVKVGTNTQTFLNPPTLPYVQLGGFWQLSNTNVNCKIKQTALFNTALTDAELAALTA